MHQTKLSLRKIAAQHRNNKRSIMNNNLWFDTCPSGPMLTSFRYRKGKGNITKVGLAPAAADEARALATSWV